MLRLLDLRFANDVLLFANTRDKVQNPLDTLVRHLAAAGLVLNTSKTVALTTEAQTPSFIQVRGGHMIKVLGHTESHKWLGCMLCAYPGQDSDVEHHLEQGAKAFQKHRWMLQCKDRSIKHRPRYFDAVVSSTAFAAEPRPLYRKHLEKYDSMTFNFENLFVALWCLRRARISQRNGMIFCMTGICAWITGPVPVEFRRDSILEFCSLHCKFTCRTLGEESTCVATASNISFPWTPTTSLGH